MTQAVPTVTVLMTAYRAAEYVGAAARSVLAQTYDDFEFLAFDDGSPDATADVLEAIASEDRRLVVHRREHGNYVDRLNEGLSMARGRYVARQDADDISEPDRLDQQVRLLEARPEVIAVVSRMTEIDPLGVTLNVTRHEPEHADIDAGLMAGNGWSLPHPTAVFRREAVRMVGGYRPEALYAEDLDLFLRLAEAGELANVPEPLVRYRRHLRSVTYTRDRRQREVIRRAVAEARGRRGLPSGPRDDELVVFRARPPSRRALLQRWGWNALKQGEVAAARAHARALVRLAPWSPSAWKLAACSIRGH